jgi:hypothetical protein
MSRIGSLTRALPFVAFATAAALVIGYLGPSALPIVCLFLIAGLVSAAILLRPR